MGKGKGINHCNGCLTHYGPSPELNCQYLPFNKDGECPCSKCIVKMICSQTCDWWRKWTKQKIQC